MFKADALAEKLRKLDEQGRAPEGRRRPHFPKRGGCARGGENKASGAGGRERGVEFGNLKGGKGRGMGGGRGLGFRIRWKGWEQMGGGYTRSCLVVG